MNHIRIVFMGTPDFAVPSLEILVENNFEVAAVITAPDKPQGRGQRIIQSPLKEAALKHNIRVLQPSNLKSPEFLEELRQIGATLQVVVAFRMLPEVVWSMPALGTFNLHGSLLPQYRGAAPINWAVMNGEKETGVTTFLLKHEIDTGSILFQEKETITESDTAGTVYDRLMHKGAQLVLKTVQAIQSDDYKASPQPDSGELKHAPKIFKETCEIDWTKSRIEVRNFIRGLSPYPGAWTMIDGKFFKIFGSELNASEKKDEPAKAGQFTTDNKHYLYFKTSDGMISITELQPEGKKRMGVEDFFRGNKL